MTSSSKPLISFSSSTSDAAWPPARASAWRAEGGARQPDAAKPAGKSLAQIVAEMDRDGVQTSVIHRMPNDLLAKIVQVYPTRLFGLATLSPFDGMRGVRELERLVREEKVQ